MLSETTASAFAMVGTGLVILLVAIYILMCAACIGFFARRRSGFNWLSHLIIPLLGIAAFVPAWLTAAGIKAPPGQRAPRLHDLRHVFTVSTLLDWYRDGGDVQARLPVLSTWLGHIDPKSTYWYLSAVPELLALAAGRIERADEEAAS